MTKKLDLFIDGKFVQSETKDWLEVLDPSTQELLCEVPFATDKEINVAIDSAKKRTRTIVET